MSPTEHSTDASERIVFLVWVNSPFVIFICHQREKKNIILKKHVCIFRLSAHVESCYGQRKQVQSPKTCLLFPRTIHFKGIITGMVQMKHLVISVALLFFFSHPSQLLENKFTHIAVEKKSNWTLLFNAQKHKEPIRFYLCSSVILDSQDLNCIV